MTEEEKQYKDLDGENAPTTPKKGKQGMSSAEKKGKKVSRKEFVKGTAVGAAGVAAAGVLAGCAPAETPTPQVIKETVEVPVEVTREVIKEVEVQPWLPEKWDYEADVVVVGYGGAGAVAAITAHDAGASVLVLEKMADGGGTTRVSGGGFMTPLNVDDGLAYFDVLRQGSNATREMIEALVQEAAKNLEWMAQLGAPESVEYGGAQFPAMPGSESIKKYHVTGPDSSAENLWKVLDESVLERKIEVMFSTPAKHLITTCDGEVIGVMAESGTGEIAIKAKRAVILTTGGFEFNEVMLRNFVHSQPYLTTASPGNTGDGISMAQKVGAALWHMTMPLGPYLGPAYPELKGAMLNLSMPTNAFIIVDKYAQRVVNETHAGAHQMLWHKGIMTFVEDDQGLIEFPAIPAHVIFDEASRAKGPIAGSGYVERWLYQWSKDNTAEIDNGWIVKAETIEELATKVGMDPAALNATVNTYNEYCESQHDPDFARDPKTLLPIITPPYYGIEVWPGFLCTEGGPKRNPQAQVVDPYDNPIPRLYSAGEMGSIAGFLYQGANDIGGECMAFGRIAGRNAAAETPWE